ncbi:hypothetical protein QUF64_10805 [Anaerolineales bacterium HSG6]|nr:hypothetical protein [Anaerolineales bacterium HSG6]
MSFFDSSKADNLASEWLFWRGMDKHKGTVPTQTRRLPSRATGFVFISPIVAQCYILVKLLTSFSMMVTSMYPLPITGGCIPAKYPLRLHNRNDQEYNRGMVDEYPPRSKAE